LDVDSTTSALELIRRIGPTAGFYKIGMELYAAGGMPFVSEVAASGKKVFLDLKLYDISETVKRTSRQIAKQGVATFLTIHASRSLMQAAVEGRGDYETKLLAVTVLTSFSQDDLTDLGHSLPLSDLVELRVKKAVESRMDGIICSPLEVARVRSIAGPEMLLVTPGVRSAGSEKGDQKRVATPAEAIASGADYLVIGRQVTRAEDPRAACEKILDEISTAV
jgi:orotidine-5'-phosphate decarboxylase